MIIIIIKYQIYIALISNKCSEALSNWDLFILIVTYHKIDLISDHLMTSEIAMNNVIDYLVMLLVLPVGYHVHVNAILTV